MRRPALPRTPSHRKEVIRISRRAVLAGFGSMVFAAPVSARTIGRDGSGGLEGLRQEILSLLDAPPAVGTLPDRPHEAGDPARALWLQIAHSGEEAHVPFWRDGVLLTDGYSRLCYLMRDWRQARMARMDPSLFHVLWGIQQSVGRGRPLKLLSGYRTRETNEILRRTSEGVAVNSQHIEARAADIAIERVSPADIAEAGTRLKLGGVGLYPGFCHLDRGPVRHWSA